MLFDPDTSFYTVSSVSYIYLYFEREGKTEEALTTDRENNSFS